MYQLNGKKKLESFDLVTCKIAESTGSTLEQVRDMPAEDYLIWLEYFSQSPPIKELLNYSQGNICFTLAAINKGKGQRSLPLSKFLFDFEKAYSERREDVSDKIDRIFGAMVTNGKK